jgi:hypothetical protein
LLEGSYSFEELCKILYLKLFSQDEALTELIPGEVEDLAWIINSREDELRFHLKVGPLRKNEIPGRISFNKELHFDPSNEREDYVKAITRLPDVAMLIDFDIFRVADDIPVDQALDFLDDARGRIDQFITRFSSFLFAAG